MRNRSFSLESRSLDIVILLAESHRSHVESIAWYEEPFIEAKSIAYSGDDRMTRTCELRTEMHDVSCQKMVAVYFRRHTFI